MIKINILKPIGFCFGVENAIDIAIKSHEEHNNIYVFGMLVHNENVIDDLSKKGIKTINTSSLTEENKIEVLNSFKESDFIIFTAHGTQNKYKEILDKNNVKYIDTICPIVKMNHDNIIKDLSLNKTVIFIGISNHPETISTMSLSNNNIFLYDIRKPFNYDLIVNKNIEIFSQTTLSEFIVKPICDDIIKHFPNAHMNKSLCNNTTIRQNNILKDKTNPDLVIIVGSKFSSNTTELYNLAIKKYKDCKVIMINSVKELVSFDFKNIKIVTISSGTSTNKTLVDSIIKFIESK
ncbi:MAG: 4-hydroxy-3-methylbut-2-enyl diphosphate reductase [Bacilli bacterium]